MSYGTFWNVLVYFGFLYSLLVVTFIYKLIFFIGISWNKKDITWYILDEKSMKKEKVTFTASVVVNKNSSVKVTIPNPTIDKLKQDYDKVLKNKEICDFTMEFNVKEDKK